MCIYIYIYTHTYTYIHTYIHVGGRHLRLRAGRHQPGPQRPERRELLALRDGAARRRPEGLGALPRVLPVPGPDRELRCDPGLQACRTAGRRRAFHLKHPHTLRRLHQHPRARGRPVVHPGPALRHQGLRDQRDPFGDGAAGGVRGLSEHHGGAADQLC